MNRLKKFMINGALMALAAIAMRFAGLLLNVFVTRKLGASGMGLLSLVNSVFGFALTFSTAGVNLAATRLCAEALSRNSGTELRKALGKCILYAMIVGILCSLFLFSLADVLAGVALSAPKTASSLRLLAVSMPLFSLSSVLGGYFSAVRKAWKNAVGAVLEQGVKIATVMGLFVLITPKSDAQACLMVIAGTVVSQAISCLVSVVLYVFDLRSVKGEGKERPGLTARMFSIALPVAISSYIRSGLVTIEHMLIPSGLARAGKHPEAALATYGVVQGMVFPVIFFPTALLYAFTGLVIPEMTREKEQHNRAQIRRVTEKVLHLTLLFSVLCAGVLFVMADGLGMALYKNASAGYYIRVLAPLIPVMYLDSATDALLKGLGEQIYTMKVNVLDALLSLVLVMLLVPRVGIWGYIGVVYVSEAVNLAFSLARLHRVTSVLPCVGQSIALPCLGVLMMLPLGHSSLVGFLGLRCFLAVGVYFLFLWLSGGIGRDDRELLKKTFGKKEEKCLHKNT